MADAGAPEAADLADHPGRPRGRDEIDPELIRLPRPRPRIGWLLSLSVLVFCSYFMVRLVDDLVFSRRGDGPERLADLDAFRRAAPNSFAEVAAVPDRAFLLWVHTSEASDGHRIAPVLGSAGRAWLMLPGSHLKSQVAYDEVYRGRVRRLGDMPFYGELVRELGEMKVPRVLTVEGARREVDEGDGVVIDPAGEALPVREDTPVTVTERVAGMALLTAFGTEAMVDEETWRRVLEEAGVLAPGAPSAPAGQNGWSFETGAPDGVDALNARLLEAKLLAARAKPLDRVHQTTWGRLGTIAIPWSSITGVAVYTPRDAPADARVLVTTERPDDYWYVLVLYVAFGLFALLFGWAFFRTVRSDLRAARERPTANQES
jgi:hypothetical protein